jgi:hypothetical protein
MANRYATKTGNWSDVTVWDGGTTLPGVGDVVRPNGFTVTIDQDVDLGSGTLTSNASAPAASNGSFLISSLPGGAGRTITANILGNISVVTGFVLVSATGGILNIVGNITGAPNASGSSRPCVAVTGAGVTLNVTGNLLGGSNTNNHAVTFATTATGATITIVGAVTGDNAAGGLHLNGASAIATITGNVTGGISQSVSSGVYVQAATCTVTINGDVIAGVNGSSSTKGGVLLAGASPILVINGDVYGADTADSLSSTNWTAGLAINGSTLVDVTINGDVISQASEESAGIVLQSGTGDVVINGNLIGGSGTNGAALHLVGGTFEVLVDGNVTGGTAGASMGIDALSGSTGNVHVTGDVAAGAGGPGMYGPASTPILVDGTFTDSSTGYSAAAVARLVLPQSPAVVDWTVRRDNGFPTAGTAMATTNIGDNGMPAPADVTAGVVYGVADEHTGTMQTSEISPAELWDALVADLDTANSIGLRLRDAATVDAVGAQIAAGMGA